MARLSSNSIAIWQQTGASSPQRVVFWVIVIALVVRLMCLFVLPTKLMDDSGSYLTYGKVLINNQITRNEAFTFAPLYAMIAGTTENLFSHPDSLMMLRLLQVVLGALTCGLISRITLALTKSYASALIAGLGIAFNPIFLIDSTLITTETTFIFLIVWGISLYVSIYTRDDHLATPKWIFIAAAAVGALFGLATLTRAVTLLFPVFLAGHLLLVLPIRRALTAAVLLLLAYAITLSPWTVYNLVKFNRMVIGASGFSDLLFVGAVGYTDSRGIDKSYAELNGEVPDANDRNAVAVESVQNVIASSPINYVLHRASELINAILQPHQTVYFPGESLKALAVTWLQSDRSLNGLLSLTAQAYFWPKLALYAVHFCAVIFGLVGILMSLRRLRWFAPVMGIIAYFLLVHFFLLAIPRYLFPATPFLWVFAGIALVRVAFIVRVRSITPSNASFVPLHDHTSQD